MCSAQNASAVTAASSASAGAGRSIVMPPIGSSRGYAAAGPLPRPDAKRGGGADRLARFGNDDRVKERIRDARGSLGPLPICGEIVERAPRQIGPHPPLAVLGIGGEQLSGMTLWVERLDGAE